jgi:hypothetical protein
MTSSKVRKTFYHEKTDGYLIVNDFLRLTTNHPMYVNGEWKTAGEINIGDSLLDKDGNVVVVTSIELVDETVPTYNLEVAGTHNYFAEDILTHNKCARVFTHNGKDYQFDMLLNVDQFGKDRDMLYSYPAKHLVEPKILVELDPDEINYVDFIEIHITDKADKSWWQFWMEDKSYVLKPISCKGCELSDIMEQDKVYATLDESNTEFYVEFEEMPELKDGYEREIEIFSSGYQERTKEPDYRSYPDYVSEFMVEYMEAKGIGNSFNTISNNIVTNNGDAANECGIKFSEEDNSTVSNNNVSHNYLGICMAGFAAVGDVNITNNYIFNNTNEGLYFTNIDPNTLMVWHNNIYDNAVGASDNEVNSNSAIELSNGTSGNYWGNACPSAFAAGTDSNTANVADSYPYGILNGWLSVEPDCCGTTLSSSANMTQDITGCTGNGLTLGTNGVVLDCKGYTIDVDLLTSSGVSINADNTVVKNCNVNDSLNGISISFGADNNQIFDNNLTANRRGITFSSSVSQNNITTNNILNSVLYGLYFANAGTTGGLNNKIYHNNIYGSGSYEAYTNTAGSMELSYNRQLSL